MLCLAQTSLPVRSPLVYRSYLVPLFNVLAHPRPVAACPAQGLQQRLVDGRNRRDPRLCRPPSQPGLPADPPLAQTRADDDSIAEGHTYLPGLSPLRRRPNQGLSAAGCLTRQLGTKQQPPSIHGQPTGHWLETSSIYTSIYHRSSCTEFCVSVFDSLSLSLLASPGSKKHPTSFLPTPLLALSFALLAPLLIDVAMAIHIGVWLILCIHHIQTGRADKE